MQGVMSQEIMDIKFSRDWDRVTPNRGCKCCTNRHLERYLLHISGLEI